MKKWAIVTDSCSDLSKDFRDKYNIDYVKMLINWTDEKGVSHEEIADLDWKTLSSKEFYDIIRRGIRIRTSQATMFNYLDIFEKHLENGEDVLYLACSSGLSASLNTAILLSENELREKYPNNRVIVLDSLRAGMSLGMIVMKAQELKDEGKSIDEVADYINKVKLTYKEIGIPETLTYLRRAGRVSAGAAFMGNMISLKPILVFNDLGINEAKEKAVGRKKAYARMAEMIKEDIVDPENQTIYLMHADAEEKDVQGFINAIKAKVTVKEIITQPLGPIIGASSGPGTLICNYIGKHD